MAVTDPAFFYYPSNAGSLEVLDLAEPLSDLQETPIRDVDDAYDGAGNFFRVVHAGRYRVRIVLERFTARSLERDLMSMSAHLERGGSVGFSNVRSKTWLALRSPSDTWSRADNYIQHQGNAFTCWYSSADIAALDEIVIESTNPEMYRDFSTVASLTNSRRVALGQVLRYSYSTDPAVPVTARYRDFWPVLRLPKDQLGKPIVTHDHRIAWTLDVTLEYQYAELAQAFMGWQYAGGELPLATTTNYPSNYGGGHWTFDNWRSSGISGLASKSSRRIVPVAGV